MDIISSSELFIKIVKALNKRPSLRNKLLIIFGSLDFVSIAILVLEPLFYWNPIFEIASNICAGIAIVMSLGLFITICSFFPQLIITTSLIEKLDHLADERIKIEHKIKEGSNGNVQEIIKLNLNQLDEYYTINKSQSKSSYSFSIFMIIIGLLLVFATIMISFMDSDKYVISMITGFAGLISEFIGATSLTLYKESNKQLNQFIKRLTYLQKIMLAIDLTEKLPDNEKNEQISNIIEGLLNLEVKME